VTDEKLPQVLREPFDSVAPSECGVRRFEFSKDDVGNLDEEFLAAGYVRVQGCGTGAEFLGEAPHGELSKAVLVDDAEGSSTYLFNAEAATAGAEVLEVAVSPPVRRPRSIWCPALDCRVDLVEH